MANTLINWYDSMIMWYENMIERRRARRLWGAATGYNDMLRINVGRLTDLREGLLRHPDPDPVVLQMLAAQIALNEIGLFTYQGQPGGTRTVNADTIEHRAYVCLIIDDQEKDWLADQLFRGGHLDHSLSPLPDPAQRYQLAILELHDPDDRYKHGPVGPVAVNGLCVTRIQRPRQTPTTTPATDGVGYAGAQLTAAQIHTMFPVGPDAAAQLYRGRQVMVYASEFGDSDLYATLADICKTAPRADSRN